MTHKFKTTKIKGKDYVEVNQRLLYFRTCKDYAGWSIETEWISVDMESATARAIIADDTGRVRATGTAQEIAGNGNINRTSHVENCETSAWGRALGCLGIGIETSIASAEEVDRAVKNQGGSGKKYDLDSGTEVPRKTARNSDGITPHPEHNTPNWKKGIAAVFAAAGEVGLTEDDLKLYAYSEFSVDSMTQLSVADLRKLYKQVKAGDAGGSAA